MTKCCWMGIVLVGFTLGAGQADEGAPDCFRLFGLGQSRRV